MGHNDRNDRKNETETKVDETEQAIASLPTAKQMDPGDDFTGSKNSQVVNPPRGPDGKPLIWWALPRDIPGKVQEYEDNGYVRASSRKFGVNPVTGKPEYLRTRGPMPGHVLMVCDLSIRARHVKADARRRASLKQSMQAGNTGKPVATTTEEGGVLDAPDIAVTRPGQ